MQEYCAWFNTVYTVFQYNILQFIFHTGFQFNIISGTVLQFNIHIIARTVFQLSVPDRKTCPLMNDCNLNAESAVLK